MIVIDTSFFISLFLAKDPRASKAEEIYPTIHEEKVVTEDILKEALTIVSQRVGKAGSIDAYRRIARDCTILPVSPDRFSAGLTRFLDPKTPKDISLIDCITTAVCRDMGIKRILSFDRHFRALGLTVYPVK
ncbi:hypothetical protein A2973_01980 [Candidatus Gottesmanbacteria bacterium RIFCSPLOWO2_01_FULL_49_10]|uniref:PIN domain-containing protein n=1 Tax=Candidatus Gottesmanbacteria bacterium RIFCSPLOWO2_01_FULL_49_10 TaxID=1798396 RepID=A0A1F6AWC9_9BACT|nr:MAG: hypothetical protein A2973_01980 [Candidatus Gottesmanbacteria bacterium RIFCSPLOWO2_01_FULL_49_10]